MATAKHTCSVHQCDRPIKNKARALCDAHYKRYWRTGDAQSHIPIPPARKAPVAVQDFMDGTRTCQDCSTRLPLSEFHNDARAPGGKRKSCKTCRISRETARYNAAPQEHRDRMRKYRTDNPERARAVDMQRYERHKDKRLALAIAQSHLRRARIAGQPYERGITVPALRRKHGDQCCYCGVTMLFASFPAGERDSRQATLEHVIPISRGGSHTWVNCALACWGCNIRKGAKSLADFTQQT